MANVVCLKIYIAYELRIPLQQRRMQVVQSQEIVLVGNASEVQMQLVLHLQHEEHCGT